MQMIVRTPSCTQTTDMRKGYAILFEIKHVSNEKWIRKTKKKKKKGALRKKK